MSNTDPPELPTQMIANGCPKLFLCILFSAQIAVGTVYLNECPMQPYIPIYLIVMGVIWVVLLLLSDLHCDQWVKKPPFSLLRIIHSLVPLFLFCWFIAGNVWIYSVYQPNYNKTMTHVETYCDKTLYLFAFWTTTLFYILLGLYLLCFCCMACWCSWMFEM